MKPRRPPDLSVIPRRTAGTSRVEPSLHRGAADVAAMARPGLRPALDAVIASPSTPSALPDPSQIELPGAVDEQPAPAPARVMPTLEPAARTVVDASRPIIPEDPEAPRAAPVDPEPELPTIGLPPEPDPAGPLFRPPSETAVSELTLARADDDDATVLVLEPAAVSAGIAAAAPSPYETPARPLPELRPSRRGGALSRLDAHLQSANRFLDRYPWLMPTVSFSVGWVGFFLFQRGESLARGIAVIALLGWPWLFAENLIGRWVVARSNGRLSVSAVRFVTQQIQQEILFFAVPFLFGAMVLEPGQMLFVGVAIVVAILISLDPIYLHRIAPHAGLSSALHAYCTLIAALVVLPVALHLPLDEALPLSIAITALSLLLSLPRMLVAAPNNRMRLLGCAVLAAVFPLMWASRAMIPPAGLWVREARITDRIDGLEPGPAIAVFGTSALQLNGGVAFVAVRAPTGLSQEVVFDWHREGELIDRIPAQISGGREAGFRTYSRKQNFPEDSRGHWRVDLRTPQGQLIARMGFEVN